jgi:hypothetical protein
LERLGNLTFWLSNEAVQNWLTNYHRRSLAETAVFRFKTIFSHKLRSRKIENQFGEMAIKCAALNRMTHMGMPESYKTAA